jgi:GNAT superfamily N-acetyltransferase
LEVSASVLEALQEAGIDVTDPKSLEEGFANEELMTQAREFAYKRGVPIAVFDAISGGIAGKFFAKPAATIAGKVLRGGVEMGTQMGLSAAGETTAQIVSGQELNTTAILAEALGEIGGGLPEIAVGTAIEAKRVGKRTRDLLFGIDLPKKNFEDMVDISEGAGQITQQEADELKAEFDDVQKVKDKVPEDYRSNKVIFDLIEERDRLTQEMGKVDPIFEAEYKQKIEGINQKIQEETIKQKQADRVPTKKEFSDVVYATLPKAWQDMSKEEAWKSFQELTVQDQIKFFNTATGKKEEVAAPSTTAAGITKEQQAELDKVNKRAERIQRTLQEDTEVQEEGDEPLLTAEQKKKLETELQTLNQRRDAIQKQSTAEVPVQPGAQGGQGVGGQVQAESQGPTREGEGQAETEAEKTRKVTNVSIEPPIDEDGEIDYEAEDTVRQIAKDRGLGITRDREIASVARDENGNIVGGAFMSYDNATGEYTFDVVVSEDYDGTGIGSKLLDSVIKVPEDIKDMNPKAKVKVDVVNPRMKDMLEKRGFKVTKKIGDNRFIMEPSKQASQATKAEAPTPTPTTTEKVSQKAAEAPKKANTVQGFEITRKDGSKLPASDYVKDKKTGKWKRVAADGTTKGVSFAPYVKQLEDALSSPAAAETKKTEPTPAKVPNALKDVESTTKALKGKTKGLLTEPTTEQLAKETKDKNVVTFNFDKESDVPNAFKDKISSRGEVNGKKVIRVTLPKSMADYLLAKDDPQAISEAYHKAKKDGSNPALVKAVEDLLGVAPPQPAAEGKDRGKTTPTPTPAQTAAETKTAEQLSEDIQASIEAAEARQEMQTKNPTEMAGQDLVNDPESAAGIPEDIAAALLEYAEGLKINVAGIKKICK